MSGNRFFWLKLKRDFFKRHDIRIIEGKPDGDKIVLFYLKLLCESVDHDGALRFSEEIAYDNEMLASVTNTDISIVNKAMEILEKLGMVSKDDKDTIIMHGLDSMLGSESSWAEKKRQYRDQQKTPEGQSEDNVQTMSDKSKSKRKSKRIELDEKEIVKEKAQTRKTFSPPSIEEVRAYCEERKNNVDPERFIAYYQSNGWKVGRNPMKDWRATIRTWERRNESQPERTKPQDVPYMQKEYSKEHLEQKEAESMDVLDALLSE